MTNEQDPAVPPDMPLHDLVGTEAMKGAERTSYLGILTEQDAKQLVNRHFAVTRYTDMLVHYLTNDPRLGYDSYAAVVRHAVELLTLYYIENDLLLESGQGFANDSVRHQHQLRLDAARARMRNELVGHMEAFNKEMDFARQNGDWEYIANRLRKYSEMLRDCETETERRLVRETIAESVSTYSAVVAFFQWVHSDFAVLGEGRSDWQWLAEQWMQWYHDQGTMTQ